MSLPLLYNYNYSFLIRICMFIKAYGRTWLLSWDTRFHFSWITGTLWSLSACGCAWITGSLSLEQRGEVHSWSSVTVLPGARGPLSLALCHLTGGKSSITHNFGKYHLSWGKGVVRWEERKEVNRGSWSIYRKDKKYMVSKKHCK